LLISGSRKGHGLCEKRLLNLENGVGGLYTRLMVGNRNRVFGISFHRLQGSTSSTLKPMKLRLKEKRHSLMGLDKRDNANNTIQTSAYHVKWLCFKMYKNNLTNIG